MKIQKNDISKEIKITMIEVKNTSTINPKILVIGIGGGGNNAVNRMVNSNTCSDSLEYVAINTDQMVLNNSQAAQTLTIGPKLTGGFGAGGNPEIGCASAEESEDAIKSILSGCNMAILTAGMGGGTGTGATPVIARLCKEMNILSIAVVTKPFSFEGCKKEKSAEAGIEKLTEQIDTLFVIPNNRLFTNTDKNLTVAEAFELADSVLKNTIEAITNIINNCGLINLDFNDLKSVLGHKGLGHIGISHVNDRNAIMDAMKEAIHSPLLETDLQGASHVLINCSAGLNLVELNTAISYVQEIVGNNADIIWGTVSTDENPDDISVTLIATGFSTPTAKEHPSILPKYSVPLDKVPAKASLLPPKPLESNIPLKPIIIPDFIKGKK